MAHGVKQVGQQAKNDNSLNIVQSIQHLSPQICNISIKTFIFNVNYANRRGFLPGVVTSSPSSSLSYSYTRIILALSLLTSISALEKIADTWCDFLNGGISPSLNLL